MKITCLISKQRSRIMSFVMLLALSFIPASLWAQAVQCPANIDFENGDLTGWSCYIGLAKASPVGSGIPATMSPINPTAPVNNHHTLTSGTALDPFGGFPVTAPGGGTYSLRLGNQLPGDSADRVSYTVHVPTGFKSYSFNFRYAVVLENGGHEIENQPAFFVSAYDSATHQPIDCATLSYVVDKDINKLLPGFKVSPVQSDVTYLSWQGGALPLTGQGGKTIVIEVTALDCTAGGHFGYGYFDVVACGEYHAAVSYCNLDSGFVRFIGTGPNQVYKWYTSNWSYIGTGFYIQVPVPKTPDFFYGILDNSSSSPGCLDTIKTDTVSDFRINAVPDTSCIVLGNQIQLNVNITGGVGGFSASWDNDPELSCLPCMNPIASPADTTRYFVTVSDKNGCYRRDTAYVLQAPDAGPDLPVCPLGDRPAQLHVVGPKGAQYTWYEYPTDNPGQYLDCTDCEDPVSMPTPNVYTYTVGYANCPVRDTIVIYHDTTNYIVAPQDPLIVCRPSYVNLLSQAYGPAPMANLPCGTGDPITCLAQDQDTVTSGTTAYIPTQPKNTPFFSENTYQKYQFIIKKRDLLNAGFHSGTINAMAFQTLAAIDPTTLPIENVTISLACVSYDEFPQPISNSSFATGTTVATLTSYGLTPNDWNQINFATPYSWDTTTNLLVDICVGPMTTANAAGFGRDAVAMMNGSAIQKVSNTINVCGGNAPTVTEYAQQPVVRFMYCPSPELPFVYAWQPGTFLNDSNVQNPQAYISRSIDYTVYSVGRNGCKMRDVLHVTVPQHNLGLTPRDTTVCINQPVYLHATGGTGYHWFESSEGGFNSASASLSCVDCADPIALPKVTTTYAVVYDNNQFESNPANSNYETGCPDTLFTTVHINPLPPVHSSNRDTLIAYGKSLRLYVTGASFYAWTPVGSLDDPNSPSPIASPRETTNYIVSGTDSNGCLARDTVKVMVDYRDNLLIPSGFTPNGDGRNDVFKVINASFQRLIEFRVFNRWGQEIFSTTNIYDGWDGTWKGVQQPIGNYQYLIRVAYPDGNVETYKGDINLIR
jgi:gliding motility-associated-like protein